MSEQAGTVVVTLEEDNPSFLTDSIELKKVLKDLSKHSKAAIEALVNELSHPTSSEIRIRAASKLLEFQMEAAKAVNADQMQRIIAEIKLNRMPKQKMIPLSTQDDSNEKIEGPIVDFTTIREIE